MKVPMAKKNGGSMEKSSPKKNGKNKLEVNPILGWAYITRSKHKGDRLGDLKKAKWYLDYRIAKLDDKKE